ncbi:hypothetical protein RB195_019142 [Necator americanus]|uniref:Uncharacterized protein n=1 Tax=Necator americanus TaxID=51031 RepID=A0ABR1CET7_NECAM
MLRNIVNLERIITTWEQKPTGTRRLLCSTTTIHLVPYKLLKWISLLVDLFLLATNSVPSNVDPLLVMPNYSIETQKLRFSSGGPIDVCRPQLTQSSVKEADSMFPLNLYATLHAYYNVQTLFHTGVALHKYEEKLFLVENAATGR